MKALAFRFLPLLVDVLAMRSLIEQGQGTVCTRTFFSSLVQLIPCRAAVAPFSPIPPTEACCEALKVLGQPCFCVLINGPPISSIATLPCSYLRNAQLVSTMWCFGVEGFATTLEDDSLIVPAENKFIHLLNYAV